MSDENARVGSEELPTGPGGWIRDAALAESEVPK